MTGKLAIWGTLLLTTNCLAQESATISHVKFQVDTDVFFGDQDAPAQQTRTLFSGGVAYDISYDDPNQITLVDPTRNRIILLHKAKQVRTEIDLAELNQFIVAAQKKAESSGLAIFLRGAARVESTGTSVSVGDEVLKYESTLRIAEDERMAQQYAQVADALALFNGWRSGVPPFARLALNRAIAEKKSLPEKITRTSNNTQDHCLLHINWKLSKADEALIAEIGEMLVKFEAINQSEFFALEKQVAAASSKPKQ
jgi:hypothetical protein